MSDAGGDIHYVSPCPSCIVSRVALADVSGHGQAVAAVAEKLRLIALGLAMGVAEQSALSCLGVK